MTRALAALAIVATLSATPAAACGSSATCSDVAASYHGEVIMDGIVLTWSTDDEDSSVGYYKLYRNDCPNNPGSCQVLVAYVQRAGSCGVTEDYTYTDHPASPLSAWHYTVEVWSPGGGVRSCSLDVDPE